MAKKDEVRKALDKIADELDDINQKLDHIIHKETEDFLNNRLLRWENDRL